MRLKEQSYIQRNLYLINSLYNEIFFRTITFLFKNYCIIILDMYKVPTNQSNLWKCIKYVIKSCIFQSEQKLFNCSTGYQKVLQLQKIKIIIIYMLQ